MKIEQENVTFSFNNGTMEKNSNSLHFSKLILLWKITQSCSSTVREISLFICIFNVFQVSYLGGVCDYGSVSCSLKFPNPKGCEAETRDKCVYCSSTVRRLLVVSCLLSCWRDAVDESLFDHLTLKTLFNTSYILRTESVWQAID